MAKLFETTTIKGMTIPNRFVRTATWMGMANEDGSITPRLSNVMVELAKGGVGLIITGHNIVGLEGQASPSQIGIYSDEHLAGLTDMVKAVHNAGGTIVSQLSHGGAFSSAQLTGTQPASPSVIEGPEGPICQEMTKDDISKTVKDFGEAAARAKKAGFDGVQIHGAHGWLLNQFLAPYYNHRTDEYGGPIANRARIVIEVLQSVKDAVGDQYPVLIKLNSEDLLEGGFSVDDMIQVSSMLEKAGIDAIEMSGGTVEALSQGNADGSFSRTVKEEVYWLEAAKRFKEEVNVPLMLVGGIRSYEVAEQLVEDGIADYISMSRPFIREPGIINRWKSGDTAKSKCPSDNACMGSVMEGKGVHCVHPE